MLELPFFRELSGAKTVLLAGAGGGFDIFAGLPLFFALKQRGLIVHLANLSFSFAHGDITGNWLGADVVEVTAASTGNEYYFPKVISASGFAASAKTSLYIAYAQLVRKRF